MLIGRSISVVMARVGGGTKRWGNAVCAGADCLAGTGAALALALASVVV